MWWSFSLDDAQFVMAQFDLDRSWFDRNAVEQKYVVFFVAAKFGRESCSRAKGNDAITIPRFENFRSPRSLDSRNLLMNIPVCRLSERAGGAHSWV